MERKKANKQTNKRISKVKKPESGIYILISIVLVYLVLKLNQIKSIKSIVHTRHFISLLTSKPALFIVM